MSDHDADRAAIMAVLETSLIGMKLGHLVDLADELLVEFERMLGDEVEKLSATIDELREAVAHEHRRMDALVGTYQGIKPKAST